MNVIKDRNHVIYCWEMGGGLGHISQLATVAQAFIQAGYRFSAIIKDTSLADFWLKPLGIAWYQAPVSNYSGETNPPINHADILHYCGYDSLESLVGMMSSWDSLLSLLRPDFIITEAAPTALLVAKARGYRVVNIDSGYLFPNLSTPMPPLRSWEFFQESTLLEKERRTLAVVNGSLRSLGFPEMLEFKNIFEANTYWVNWYELRYFENNSPARFLGPIMSVGRETSRSNFIGGVKGILVYLKYGNSFSVKALEWGLRTGLSVFAYLPGWPDSVLRKIKSNERIKLHFDPIDFDQALSNVSVMICHGGLGSVSKSIANGVVPLVVPSHVEQYRMYLSLLRNGLTVPFNTRDGQFYINENNLVGAYTNVKNYSARRQSVTPATDALIRLVSELEMGVSE